MKLPVTGFPYLLADVNLEDFCKRYDIKPFSIKCDKCGDTRDVKHPFYSKEHNRRGLLAEDCSCGTSSFCYISDELQKLTESIADYKPTNYQDHSDEFCRNCGVYEGPEIGMGFCNDPYVKEPTPSHGHCEEWKKQK